MNTSSVAATSYATMFALFTVFAANGCGDYGEEGGGASSTSSSSGSTSPKDIEQSAQLEALVADLDKAGVDAAPFTKALTDVKPSEEIVEILPEPYRARLTAIRDGMVPGEKPLGVRDQKIGGATKASRIAVVMIANANDNRWMRNLAEWIGLSYFDVHMRKHYGASHICVGDGGRWDCVRDGLENVASAYESIDLIFETHGFFDRNGDQSTANDNEGKAVTSRDILNSKNRARFRFGMFMNCFASHFDSGGFAQTFIKMGGRASYGARDLGSPVSDMIFQSRFGTFGADFGTAIAAGNEHFLEKISVAWNSKLYEGFGMTPKEAFGATTAHIDDGFNIPTDPIVAPAPVRDCNPGEARPCYSSPGGTRGVGACRAGNQTCDAFGAWGGCIGEVTPTAETCGNGIDEDCNGSDLACPLVGECEPGATRSCYPGPGGTQNVGACRAGVQACDGAHHWGGCTGAVLPTVERCGDGVDQDCNGVDLACPPFLITSLVHPASVRLNGAAASYSIYTQSANSYPITATLRNTSCPAGFTCQSPSTTFTTPAQPLTWSGAEWCKGLLLLSPIRFGYEMTLRDAAGRVTPGVDASFTCNP